MTDISGARAVLFIDYENARRAASALYCGDDPDAGHFIPQKLAWAVHHEYNEYHRDKDAPELTLVEVRVYRGVPDQDRANPEFVEDIERTRHWLHPRGQAQFVERDMQVTLVRSSLQYPNEWRKTERERAKPVEKEVDTAIATDMVAMAQDAQFDVAILFSRDGDMRPPVLAVLDRNTMGRAIPVHRVGWACRGEKRILRIEPDRLPDGAHSPEYPLRERHYRHRGVRDDTNYLAQYLRRYSTGEILSAEVIDANRGGLVVAVDQDLLGFVPLHELLGTDEHSTREHLKGHIRRSLTLQIIRITDDLSCLGHGQTAVTLSERSAAMWELQRRHDAGEVFDGRVTGSNKGGLLVNVEGVNAFVPLSQIVGITGDREQAIAQLGEYEGRSLRFKVIEINRRRNRVILSERVAVQEWRAEQKDRLLDELHEGEIRAGRITSIRPFGVFVDLGGADGLAHLSELSWERDVDPEQMFTIGQEVNVYITKIDKESKKIGLSIRRASPEQWDEVVAKFEVGQLVPSTVTKLVTFGAFARIEGSVEGLVHVSELADRRITHPREVVNVGDVIPVKILSIEHDRNRLGLSLRQARTDAERVGWLFDSEGRIARLPDDLAAELGIEQGDGGDGRPRR